MLALLGCGSPSQPGDAGWRRLRLAGPVFYDVVRNWKYFCAVNVVMQTGASLMSGVRRVVNCAASWRGAKRRTFCKLELQ